MGWSKTDSMVLQILANMLAGQNREQQAADLLEYACRQEPNNPDILRALCGVYAMLERHEEVLTMVERYERTVPTGTDLGALMMLRGQALWNLGRAAEATAVMNTYLARKNAS